MSKYFSDVVENQFRDKIIELDEIWGPVIVNQFKNAVERTIKYYQEGKMKYIQLVATK